MSSGKVSRGYMSGGLCPRNPANKPRCLYLEPFYNGVYAHPPEISKSQVPQCGRGQYWGP